MPPDAALLDQVLDRLQDGVLVVEAGTDPRGGRVIATNRAMAALAGGAEASLVGADPSALAAGALDQPTLARLHTALAQGQPFRAEVSWKAGQPDPTPIELVISPLGNGGGAPARWLWQFRDITERHRLEQQLWLAQRMETVGLLARGISHDFNNILTALSGYTSFLLQGIPHDDPLRADAMEIERAAREAALLLDQLLAFSRREGMRPRPLDLNQVLLALEPTLARLAGEHIHVLIDPGHLAGAVLGDERQLQQIIINLVANARDAMVAGGTLVLSTAPAGPDDLLPRSTGEDAGGSHVMLTVSDTGIGMTADTKAQLFRPFFTTKDPENSAGLGLATVQGLVRQLGGYVWVQSEVNRGTTIRVYLPVIPEAAAPGEAQDDRHGPDATAELRGGHEMILLVEDEPAILQLGRRLLEGFGYRVMPAGSAAEATALAAEQGAALDLLLTDVVMPGQHGPDLAEELLQDHPQLRVLCVSGHMTGSSPPRVRQRFPVLLKPFTATELARKVREVLDAPPAG